MLGYYLLAATRRVTIDQSLQHKMLTQVWEKTDAPGDRPSAAYKNYRIGEDNQSIHFESKYNGYLKRQG